MTGKTPLDDLNATIKRRDDLTVRLVAALAHLPVDRQLAIVSSFFSLDELEEIVRFQEKRD